MAGNEKKIIIVLAITSIIAIIGAQIYRTVTAFKEATELYGANYLPISYDYTEH